MNIAEFLKARLDEDDQAARRATEGQWVAEYSAETGHCVIPADAQSTREFVARTQLYAAAGDAEHIARHNPARVLCEIGAKRQMLRHYEHAVIALANAGPAGEVRDLMTGAVNTLRAVLLDHAQVYADHPGYRPEWRP